MSTHRKPLMLCRVSQSKSLYHFICMFSVCVLYGAVSNFQFEYHRCRLCVCTVVESRPILYLCSTSILSLYKSAVLGICGLGKFQGERVGTLVLTGVAL
jgi:hypothetical protein